MTKTPPTEPAKPSCYFDARSTFTASTKVFVAEEWEDPEAFTKLAFDYHTHFEPIGPLEIHLVDAMVQCEQDKLRATLFQTQVRAIKLDAHAGEPLVWGAAYIDDLNGPKLLPRLAREIAALERNWFRCLKQIETIQQRRREKERQAAEAAAEAVKADAEAAKAQAAKTAESSKPAGAAESASVPTVPVASIPRPAAAPPLVSPRPNGHCPDPSTVPPALPTAS